MVFNGQNSKNNKTEMHHIELKNKLLDASYRKSFSPTAMKLQWVKMSWLCLSAFGFSSIQDGCRSKLNVSFQLILMYLPRNLSDAKKCKKKHVTNK